jgi:hypothetical protein
MSPPTKSGRAAQEQEYSLPLPDTNNIHLTPTRSLDGLGCICCCNIDHNPKFCITNKTTGQAFAASTETEVWKKVICLLKIEFLSFSQT